MPTKRVPWVPATDYWRQSKVLNDGFNLITLAGPHRHAVVDFLEKTGEHPWVVRYLSMLFFLQLNQDDAKLAVAHILSKIGITSSTLICRHSKFFDQIKALVSYAGAFYLNYALKFGHARMNDIVDNIPSSEYLPA